MFGIEINAPFQVQEDYKLRVMARVVSVVQTVRAPDGQQLEYATYDISYTGKPHKQFATEDEDAAQALAETYAKSWNATVVPVDEGVVLTAEELEPIIKKERENATARLKAERALGVGR